MWLSLAFISAALLGLYDVSKKQALRDNAIAELTEKANLKGSQALINVTVKSDVQFAFIWAKRTFRAYGTVIEFD